jgi:hypothetical protein
MREKVIRQAKNQTNFLRYYGQNYIEIPCFLIMNVKNKRFWQSKIKKVSPQRAETLFYAALCSSREPELIAHTCNDNDDD